MNNTPGSAQHRMEPDLDKEDFFRPSYIAGVEPLQRTAPGSVEGFKTDLSLVCASSNTSQGDRRESTNSKAPVGCKDLEELLKGSEQSSTTAKNDVKFSLWVSFCEIYNECFYDLLIAVSNDKKRKTLRLAQDIKGCSYVKDLQWVQISDSKEAFRLLKLGLKHWSITSKKLNTCSSRR
ncbi:kinesin-like protein KIF20B [Strix uralensis]|uniref:kinesin-like protein KIF20B n=1 Tax=Strix uralensis TaxID=36305 RepID=UPI003DA6B0D1